MGKKLVQSGCASWVAPYCDHKMHRACMKQAAWRGTTAAACPVVRGVIAAVDLSNIMLCVLTPRNIAGELDATSYIPLQLYTCSAGAHGHPPLCRACSDVASSHRQWQGQTSLQPVKMHHDVTRHVCQATRRDSERATSMACHSNKSDLWPTPL